MTMEQIIEETGRWPAKKVARLIELLTEPDPEVAKLNNALDRLNLKLTNVSKEVRDGSKLLKSPKRGSDA